jgi:hypothetical protein
MFDQPGRSLAACDFRNRRRTRETNQRDYSVRFLRWSRQVKGCRHPARASAAAEGFGHLITRARPWPACLAAALRGVLIFAGDVSAVTSRQAVC